jgi:hypothetical protein
MTNFRRTISPANLPMRPPLWITVMLWLLLDRVHASAFVWGVVGVLVLLAWIVWIYDMSTREDVDLLTNRRNQ